MATASTASSTARLRLLSEAAQDLLAADDPDRMLQGLFRRASRHLPIDTYFNFMVDPDKKALHLASCAGVPETVARDLRRLEFGQAVCGTVAATGDAICATCIQESDDPLTELVRSLGIRAYACNPLRVGERVIGTLSFGSRTRDRFDPEDLEFFRAICRCVTNAYGRLRSEAALRQSERDLRQSRQRVMEQMRALAEQDRHKNEFLAMLGHELRNPLAALWTDLEVLQHDADPRTGPEVRDRMASQVLHLRTLIDDLLDISRISRGTLELRKEPCPLAPLVARALDTLRPRAVARRQRVELELVHGLHASADPDRLLQVVTNLLDNAIRHTPEGGCIGVSLEAEPPWVTLRVRDTGPGVPASLERRIFEPFAQGREQSGGLGLGLALVRRIADLHGGRVWVESGGSSPGSEFVFQVPGPCDPPAVASLATVSEPADSGDGAPPVRVLVVDDNVDAAVALSLLLRRSGHEIYLCHTGSEAAARARAVRPHVVLLDIGLPDLDGCLVAERIRRDPTLETVRLVALTGYSDAATAQRIAEAEFDAVLLKPTDRDALLRVLRSDGGAPAAARA